jgi:hypothetical protein
MADERTVADVEHEHGRSMADTIVMMEYLGWRRGWLVGFITGAAAVAAVYWLGAWTGYW